MNLTQKSKFLSLILRHKPEVIGLKLDKEGWADVGFIVASGRLTLPEIIEIVATDEKGRYSLSDDQSKIRANQGHSLKDVSLEFHAKAPPAYLYHGTPSRNESLLLSTGIKKMARHHVHLSQDKETATSVGSRRGEAIILTVDAKAMHSSGINFFLSDNGVWLVDFVPPKYIVEVNRC